MLCLPRSPIKFWRFSMSRLIQGSHICFEDWMPIFGFRYDYIWLSHSWSPISDTPRLTISSIFMFNLFELLLVPLELLQLDFNLCNQSILLSRSLLMKVLPRLISIAGGFLSPRRHRLLTLLLVEVIQGVRVVQVMVVCVV